MTLPTLKQENDILWAVQYWILSRNPEVATAIETYIEACWNKKKKMFNQRPINNGSHEDYISHDQMTAFCVYSVLQNKDYHVRFWKGVKFGCYNNLSPAHFWKRPLHPRDYLWLSAWNGKNVGGAILPFALESYLSVWKVRGNSKMLVTDGKILHWMKFRTKFSGYEIICENAMAKKHPVFNTWKDFLYHYHRSATSGYGLLIKNWLETH